MVAEGSIGNDLAYKLRRIFSPTRPFGPDSTRPHTDMDVLHQVFLSEQHISFDLKNTNRAILMGRRGAGKSTFIESAKLSNDSMIVDLVPNEAFEHIVKWINVLSLDKKGDGNFVESTASL